MSDSPPLGSRTPLPVFQQTAPVQLTNRQLRRNLARATKTIRGKRARVTAEVPHWESLREDARAAKDRALGNLDALLDDLEGAVARVGGKVHRAGSSDDAQSLKSSVS